MTAASISNPPSDQESWLAAFSAALLEATWLAAILVVPLLCSPYALAGFEPQKIIFLELLATIALAAAAARFVETRCQPRSAASSTKIPRPLCLGFAAVALSLLVSTVVSLVPAESLWGSYELRFNAMARGSLLVLGSLVALHARTPAQIERLITAAITAAVPVAVYALIQKAGADPLLRIQAGARTPSLIGHAIFLGSYLLLILPVCLWRAFGLGLDGQSKAKRGAVKMASLVCYRLIVILSLAAFLATESRGPLLGLLAALVFFAGVGSVLWGRRRLLGLGLGMAGTCLLFLTVLSLPDSPLAPLRSIPIFDRFALIVPTVELDSSRNALWNEAWKLATRREPLPFPQGIADRFAALRPLFGFGPETLDHVLPLQFPGFGIRTSPDPRFHNLLWDIWFTTGLAGLAAFLGLFTLLFFKAYQRLGFMASPRDRTRFWIVVGLAAAAGTGGFAGLFGPGFCAPGLAVGLVAGLAFVPFLHGRLPAQTVQAKSALLLALLAALAGHLVDTAFSWQVAVPALIFWVWAGLIAALLSLPDNVRAGRERSSADVLVPEPGREISFAGWPATALVVLTLGFAFSLEISAPIGAMMVAVTFCAAFLFMATAERDESARGKLAATGRSLAGALAVAALGFGLLLAIGPRHALELGENGAMARGSRLEILALLFLAASFALVIALAFQLRRSVPDSIKISRAGGIAMLVILPLSGWFASTVILPAYRADVWAWWGERVAVVATADSFEPFRKAIALSPTQLPYRTRLLQSLVQAAEAPSLASARETLFAEAEHLMLAARAITPLDRAGGELGHLYLRWAMFQDDAAARKALGEKAAAMLDQALEFERRSAVILTDRAIVDRLILGNPEAADEMLAKADEYSRPEDPQLWVTFYQNRASGTPLPALRQQYLRRTIHYLDGAVMRARMQDTSPYISLTTKGTLQRNLGEIDRAIESFHRAVENPPLGGPWQANAMLAHCYLDKGDRTTALQHAARALADAPPETKPALQQLQTKILGIHQF